MSHGLFRPDQTRPTVRSEVRRSIRDRNSSDVWSSSVGLRRSPVACRSVGSCTSRPVTGGHTYLLGLLSIVLAPVEAEEEEEEEQAVRADVPEGDGRVVALAEHQLERVRHDGHELDLEAERGHTVRSSGPIVHSVIETAELAATIIL